MRFAFWMVLAAAILPIVTVGLAKANQREVFDNAAPRASMERFTGWQRRAEWAHRNHIEAFAPFAAAVIIATIAHGDPAWIDFLAGLFVVARVVYTALYIADAASLRSAAWAAGFACVVGLFCLGA